MKNFMAIHEAHDDEAALAYKTYFNDLYPEKMTHGEWAKTTVGEFATGLQVWQGKSNFYCTHFQADSEEDVFKRWCQTNRLKYQKPWERAFYEAIRDRHSVRAASRFSLKVLRVESDLCELK